MNILQSIFMFSLIGSMVSGGFYMHEVLMNRAPRRWKDPNGWQWWLFFWVAQFPIVMVTVLVISLWSRS